MYGTRDNLFAGTVFSGDEDVGIRGSDTRDRLQDWRHRRRSRDKFRTPLSVEQPVLGSQPLCVLQSAMKLHLGAEDGDQAFVFPRLLNKIARTAPHCLYR